MVEISTITNHEAMVGTSAVFIVPSVEEATSPCSRRGRENEKNLI
jgi:hypothetical protein